MKLQKPHYKIADVREERPKQELLKKTLLLTKKKKHKTY